MEAAEHTGMNNQLNDNNRFDRLEALIRSQIGGLRAEMGSELGGVKAELRGVNVRLDSLHSQIKIVAEGHGALVDNITDVKAGIARLEKGQDHLQLRMIAVESRLGLTR
jgi:hypothetical protein